MGRRTAYTLIVSSLLLSSACASWTQQRNKFLSSLTCGMTVEEVRLLSKEVDSRVFECYHPGHEPLVCETGWRKRDGVQCLFDTSDKLVGHKVFRLRSFTQMVVLQEEKLCQ